MSDVESVLTKEDLLRVRSPVKKVISDEVHWLVCATWHLSE